MFCKSSEQEFKSAALQSDATPRLPVSSEVCERCACASFSLRLSISFSSATVLSSAAVWPGTILSVPGQRECVSAARRMAAAPTPRSRFALIGATAETGAWNGERASERSSSGRRHYRRHLASPLQKWNLEPVESSGCCDQCAFNRKQINKKKHTHTHSRASTQTQGGGRVMECRWLYIRQEIGLRCVNLQRRDSLQHSE